jgi:hypothetical protein
MPTKKELFEAVKMDLIMVLIGMIIGICSDRSVHGAIQGIVGGFGIVGFLTTLGCLMQGLYGIDDGS